MFFVLVLLSTASISQTEEASVSQPAEQKGIIYVSSDAVIFQSDAIFNAEIVLVQTSKQKEKLLETTLVKKKKKTGKTVLEDKKNIPKFFSQPKEFVNKGLEQFTTFESERLNILTGGFHVFSFVRNVFLAVSDHYLSFGGAGIL